jgi:hypothetical protein
MAYDVRFIVAPGITNQVLTIRIGLPNREEVTV